MICADSMHSKKKIAEKYPYIDSRMIEQLYGLHVSGEKETMWEIRKSLPNLFKLLRRRADKEYKNLNAINLTQFYSDTPPVSELESKVQLYNQELLFKFFYRLFHAQVQTGALY